MSQRIYFLYQILFKIPSFEENGKKKKKKKKHLFGKTFLDKTKKKNLQLKVLKFLENHVY